MPRFILKFLIGALALWAATKVVPGMSIDSLTTLAIAAILLGVVNAVVRPILIILTFPLTLVTLGLFLFVVNGVTVSLVDAILPGMKIDSFGHAMLAALVIWVVSWATEMILGVRTRQSEQEG
jgi:putative membrane protein